MPTLHLKPGREKSLLRRHPWIFSGAVERITGNPPQGEALEVVGAKGEFLGWAAYSPQSQITARVWSFQREAPITAGLIHEKLQRAIMLRERLGLAIPEGGVRLVHAESDGLPGLVVDRYAGQLVLQITSAGAHRWRDSIVESLTALTGVTWLFERSDSEALEQEGLPVASGPLSGSAPEDGVVFEESNLRFSANVTLGHKTGFYLDQRDNRALLGKYANGLDVLDCFCYSGGFSCYALAGGARSVTCLDSSQPALDSALAHIRDNSLDTARASFLCDDVFLALRRFRDQGRNFDCIVLDPPKFAPRASLAGRAARGYKDINLLAFKLLRPGGLLFTFSCSGGVAPDLFQKIVAGAALDAGADAKILHKLGAAPDHPVALNFPEGEYLKGLVCLRH
ncbi:MAG: class I SAM-dependent rRNA methyltransferase [Burkholderiales bacterium]